MFNKFCNKFQFTFSHYLIHVQLSSSYGCPCSLPTWLLTLVRKFDWTCIFSPRTHASLYSIYMYLLKSAHLPLFIVCISCLCLLQLLDNYAGIMQILQYSFNIYAFYSSWLQAAGVLGQCLSGGGDAGLAMAFRAMHMMVGSAGPRLRILLGPCRRATAASSPWLG